MGTGRYEKAQGILEAVRKEHGDELIDIEILIAEIIKQAGADPIQTVRPYLKMMRDMKMIDDWEDNKIIILWGDKNGGSRRTQEAADRERGEEGAGQREDQTTDN